MAVREAGDRVTPRRAPSISVVVCTRNRAWSLARTLDALAAQTLGADDYDVVVVDNGSTDDTSAVARRYTDERPNVSYVVEPLPGLSRARNRGVAAAMGDVVAFVDDDAEPDPRWLESVRAAYAERGVDAVGGPVELVWPNDRPPWLPRALGGYYAELDLGVDPHRIDYPTYPYGVNMAIRRRLLETTGGFDAELGRTDAGLLAHEEADLFRRLRDVGATVWYEPGALVRHHIEPERASRRWLIRRAYAQGCSRARYRAKTTATRPRALWAAVGLGSLLWAPARTLGFVVHARDHDRRATARMVRAMAAGAQTLGYARGAFALAFRRARR